MVRTLLFSMLCLSVLPGCASAPVAAAFDPAAGVIVQSPLPGARVTSPLIATGTAPEFWYVEQQFGQELILEDGGNIGRGQRGPQRREDGSFRLEVRFNVASETPATLVLREDMPPMMREDDSRQKSAGPQRRCGYQWCCCQAATRANPEATALRARTHIRQYPGSLRTVRKHRGSHQLRLHKTALHKPCRATGLIPDLGRSPTRLHL